jgi:hypothetical protein
MTPDLHVLNWKSSYDVMLLMFQSRQQHFAEFYFVRFLDQGYARIILSTILNLRIISIKRFFSMHSQTLNKRPSDFYVSL